MCTDILKEHLQYEFETVLYSKNTIKINPKGTAQKRYILISDMFFYVLKNKIFSSSYQLQKVYKLTNITKIELSSSNGLFIQFTNGKVHLNESDVIKSIFEIVTLQLSKYYEKEEMPEIIAPAALKTQPCIPSPKYLFVKEFFKLDMGIPPEEFIEFCNFLEKDNTILKSSYKFLKVGQMLNVMSKVETINKFVFDDPINSYNLTSLANYFSNVTNINTIEFTAPINADIKSIFENLKQPIEVVLFDNVSGPHVNSAIKSVLQSIKPKKLYLTDTIINKLSINGIDKIEYQHPHEVIISGIYDGAFGDVTPLFAKSQVLRFLNCNNQNASQLCEILSKIEQVDINELELNRCVFRSTFNLRDLPKSIQKLVISQCKVNSDILKMFSILMNSRDIQVVLQKLQFDGVSESDAVSIISVENDSKYLFWENNFVNSDFFDSVLDWPNIKLLSLKNSIQPTTDEKNLASFLSEINIEILDLTDECSNMTEYQSKVILEAIGRNQTIKELRINGMRAPPMALITAMQAPLLERLVYDFKAWEAPMMAFFVEAVEDNKIKAKFDYPPEFPENSRHWLEQKRRRSSFYV